MNRAPLDRLAVAAGLVFLADFATKQWALRTLPGIGGSALVRGWSFALVNNTRLGGSVATAGYELPVTAILTTIVAVLVLRVCRPLAAIDSAAPLTLGLLIGSGAANLADALIPPHGVVDFIAFTGNDGSTMSFNVADVALVVGLALCGRMIWRIAEAMRGKIPTARPRRATLIQDSGALPMRDRLLSSAGHAMLAMCGFIWLYSMAIALTPDAGRSAPNSLLCGIGVFAVVFAVSHLRQRFADRELVQAPRSSRRGFERVVLDGSLATLPFGEPATTTPRPAPRGEVVQDDEQQRHSDLA